MTDIPNDGPSALARSRYELLRCLLGSWRGEGQVRFPTIEDFEFVEETRFSTRGCDELTLHYEQRTWIHDAGVRGEPSHWESGFFQVTDEAVIEVLNAQNSGRVEVLCGDLSTVQAAAGELTVCLDLESKVDGYDPRVVATARRYWITGDGMRYEVDMTTTEVETSTVHLSAALRRDA